MFSAFIEPEFLGCVVVYGLMFLGAWIWSKICDWFLGYRCYNINYDDSGIKEFGATHIKIPRNAAIVSRYFIKPKGRKNEWKKVLSNVDTDN